MDSECVCVCVLMCMYNSKTCTCKLLPPYYTGFCFIVQSLFSVHLWFLFSRFSLFFCFLMKGTGLVVVVVVFLRIYAVSENLGSWSVLNNSQLLFSYHSLYHLLQECLNLGWLCHSAQETFDALSYLWVTCGEFLLSTSDLPLLSRCVSSALNTLNFS